MQCGATSRTAGESCKRNCALGFTRCYLHGGASPGAKLAAEKALAFARLPAIEALSQIIEDWQGTACPTCGRPSQEIALLNPVIRACQIVLDRTGFGPRATIEVAKPEPSEIDVTRLTGDEKVRLRDAIAKVRALKAEVLARLAAEPLDGDANTGQFGVRSSLGTG